MIMVLGTITYKMAPVLKRLYDQMAEPKYVIAVGGCTISGGPFIKSYHVVNGIDKIIPWMSTYRDVLRVGSFLLRHDAASA